MSETEDNNKNGPIPVNGDITPITKQKIGQVRSSEWSTMPISELWEQKSILDSRLTYALQTGHAELIKQLQSGIAALDMVIANRSTGEDKLI